MTIALTTLFVIALLLPGVAFFVGIFSRERFSRELVKAGAIAEIGAALLVAVIIHLAFFAGLKFGFRLPVGDFIYRALDSAPGGQNATAAELEHDILIVCSYVIASTLLAYVVGLGIAWAIAVGPLRGLATHKWAYDLRGGKGDGVVTTYIMTKTIIEDKILMYEGQLNELYLTPDGGVAYIVLKDCARYYLGMDSSTTVTGPRLSILRNVEEKGAARVRWHYFHITGENIANVLFRKNPVVEANDAARQELARELETVVTRIIAKQARIERERH